MGFWLLSHSILAVIKGVYIFLNVVCDYRCIKVFKFLLHLGVRAYATVLPKNLYVHNLSLPKSFCLIATVFHRVFIEFPFGSSRDFLKGGMVNINKQFWSLSKLPFQRKYKGFKCEGLCRQRAIKAQL